jgi:hypothetical protein
MTWMKNEKSQILKFKDKIKKFTKDTCNSWTKSRLTKPRMAGSTTCTDPSLRRARGLAGGIRRAKKGVHYAQTNFVKSV